MGVVWGHSRINGGNYTSGKELKLEDVFLLRFSFGLGSPKARKQVIPVSLEVCLETYIWMALPLFLWENFLLVCNHMLNKQVSHKSGTVICKVKVNENTTIVDQVSMQTLNKFKLKLIARNALLLIHLLPIVSQKGYNIMQYHWLIKWSSKMES